MPFSAEDWAAIALTLRLAATTTVLLLVLCTPIAWWLATTRSRWRGPVGAIVALPLVLPPTVIGFYLLVTMGPNGLIGLLTESLGLGRLPFTFPGLVIGSFVYSLPFAVPPLPRAPRRCARPPAARSRCSRSRPSASSRKTSASNCTR